MATNYQRGRAFEYRARDKALKLGAEYVMRAASSKGAADLIVLWQGGMDATGDCARAWLVQAKRDGRLPKAEREELVALASNTGSIPVLAKTGKNGRGVQFINLIDMKEL